MPSKARFNNGFSQRPRSNDYISISAEHTRDMEPSSSLEMHDISLAQDPPTFKKRLCNEKILVVFYIIWTLLFLIAGVLTASVIKSLLHISTIAANHNTSILISPCGNSPTEAVSSGCHFDIMSFSWLPTRCYDAQLSSSFDSLRTWKWYADSNKTTSIPHDAVMTGILSELYVEWEYHIRHCTAMWKKLHRAVLKEGKGGVDAYIGRYEHTLHCEKVLLGAKDVALEELNTKIVLKYPDCGIA